MKRVQHNQKALTALRRDRRQLLREVGDLRVFGQCAAELFGLLMKQRYIVKVASQLLRALQVLSERIEFDRQEGGDLTEIPEPLDEDAGVM